MTISFTIVNEPIPNVTREGIQWVFTGSSGAVNLSCTSTSKYSFSHNCLNLTVSDTEGSDAGLYEIVIATEAGIGMSSVGISVSGGNNCVRVFVCVCAHVCTCTCMCVYASVCACIHACTYSAVHYLLTCHVPSCAAVKPELLTPLMNASLPQGGSHMFVCAAVADPRPQFAFRFNGERIKSNSSKHSLVTNSTHGTLTVFNLQGSDEGNYSCSVSNRYGSVSTAGVLTVQGVLWLC